MEKQTSLIQKSAALKIFLGLNTVVLSIFWFGALTDYPWYDNRVSFLYSVLVLFTSATTFFVLYFLSRFQRVPIFSVCLLTFLVALASLPLHRHHSDQTPVELKFSPDGAKFIEVYCDFVNAHVNGFDHIEIVMRYKNLPFLQRDLGLYNDYPRHCGFDAGALVHWEDDDTIYVVERQAYLHVDYIKWEGAIADPGEIHGNH